MSAYPSRVFDHPNYHGGFDCPVCRTSKDAPVVLVPIPGTEDDGIVECKQVHAACWDHLQKMEAMPDAPKDEEKAQ